MIYKRFFYVILFFISINISILANDIVNDDFEDDFGDEFEVKEVNDPFSGYNRIMTNFNDKFYIYVFDPVTRGYKKVVPTPARRGIRNIFHNLFYPIRFINNLLQAKFKNSLEETESFLINSTIGLFGIFDPAQSYFKIKPHEEDFGQTLGYWGVSSGPHIVLPILGPSNLRDAFSLYPDTLTNPIYYKADRGYNVASNYEQYLSLYSLEIVNKGSFEVGFYEKIKKDAVDLYPFLRDSYEQRREQLIKE